jgi:hypothetical protein
VTKSLAHPEWPYAGTAHEWRGFVRDGISKVAKVERGYEQPKLTCPQCYRDAEALTELGHCFRCEERQARREIGAEFHKLNFGELT